MLQLRLWASLVALASFAVAADEIICNATQSCPEDKPCCSQFGTCGTGFYCLGGCDIKSSYNLDSCMPMPIMSTFEDDFNDPKKFVLNSDYLGNYSEADWMYSGWIDTNDDAILLQMPKESTGTVISSTKYLWYGKISATIKSSRDKGVISAFILYSDVKDEIDYEFVGYNLTSPQSNFYWQGTLNYTNSENSTTTDTFENWHDYEIDWHPDHVDWTIDGKKVRTLYRNETYNATSKVYEFPQTPCRIQMSLWPGGAASNGIGTIDWAGGEISWDTEDIKNNGYYYAHVKNVKVEAYDHSTGVGIDMVDDGEDKPHAYIYNSTDGLGSDIMLTNKKTWLGSEKNTGMDPDNEDKKESSSESKSSSDSKSSSKTDKDSKSSSTSKDVPGNQGKITSSSSTSSFTGGFVQDSDGSSSASEGGSGSSSSQGSGSHSGMDVLTVLLSMAMGFLSLFM